MNDIKSIRTKIKELNEKHSFGDADFYNDKKQNKRDPPDHRRLAVRYNSFVFKKKDHLELVKDIIQELSDYYINWFIHIPEFVHAPEYLRLTVYVYTDLDGKPVQLEKASIPEGIHNPSEDLQKWSEEYNDHLKSRNDYGRLEFIKRIRQEYDELPNDFWCGGNLPTC